MPSHNCITFVMLIVGYNEVAFGLICLPSHPQIAVLFV